MTQPAILNGLSEIADQYDVLYCDVWGVLHNGIAALKPAGDALTRFRNAGGTVLLVSNAPRPGAAVIRMLDRFGVPRSAYDDIITSAGYRIGPADVESVIIEHPSVAEVAVIGKPDPERTEIVKAFVVLRQDHQATDALAKELQQHVRSRLSLHAYPREIEFLAELPKTPSGKVQRFVLRQRSAAEPPHERHGSALP